MGVFRPIFLFLSTDSLGPTPHTLGQLVFDDGRGHGRVLPLLQCGQREHARRHPSGTPRRTHGERCCLLQCVPRPNGRDPYQRASTASALGWEVSIFFTIYCLNLRKKDLDLKVAPMGNPAMPLKLRFGPNWLSGQDRVRTQTARRAATSGAEVPGRCGVMPRRRGDRSQRRPGAPVRRRWPDRSRRTTGCARSTG